MMLANIVMLAGFCGVAVTVMFAAEKVDWVEKFVRVGTKATEAARNEHDK